TRPQPPQLAGSYCTSTHAPLQLVSPRPQSTTQVAFRQPSPLSQRRPQAPQLAVSMVRSLQSPAQITAGARQTHLPAMHVSPPVQAWPQAPQFAASLSSCL